MTKEELLNASEEELLQEVGRLQYIFVHSQIIRHGLNRSGEEYQTQSVAEHIYNMMILAQYFRPLEDPESDWDWEKIHRMILWHDATELETGDTLTHHKNDKIRASEQEAIPQVMSKIPERLQSTYQADASEYEARASTESRFVKALDVVEVVISSHSEKGKARLINPMAVTEQDILYFQKVLGDHARGFSSISKVVDTLMAIKVRDKWYNQ